MILGNIKLIVKRLREAMAIVEEGDTASQSIAKGKYVIWKGTLCQTDAAIPQGGTFATSGAGKNLTAKTEGLGGEIATLNSNLANNVIPKNIAPGTTSASNGVFAITGIGTFKDIFAIRVSSPAYYYVAGIYYDGSGTPCAILKSAADDSKYTGTVNYQVYYA